MFQLIFTPSYEKRLKRFLKKHPQIKNQYAKVIQILEIDPYHPSLKIHQLRGRLKDLHSISINMGYRVSIEFIVEDKKITFVDVGKHDNVYR
ncbi:MAG: type II toxin-antitoxin system mRNA interferase toxin, RelE/StbE family [Methylococcales symbiont of Iophon sp. n. MRB-2018]|nr:MAG: type II toxin-antitoxin system mRNA interferase toxin, RelE/StbE family [Methylococcales symbiont of Iophon sp. n. MRB-2018]KAF3979895.1 MAG: type II toxin-antitoxin system mRNA interferase toxin, RelE/StbE family [Methylococcales symbiont of Iophon sp. n. MRB-2018]